jgi:hypothetical protein
VAAWIGWNAQPVYYNYYVDDGYVCNEGVQIAPVEVYAQEAYQIAEAEEMPSDNTQWMPLGVFAVLPTEDAPVDVLVQLAVSKDGAISGTYLNKAADVTLPVTGSVDKESQRVAWKVGEEDAVVMETQLESLTQDESTVLLHFEGGETEAWWMFRIDQETAEQIQAAAAASAGRTQLAESHDLLQQSLNDAWTDYLALPPEVFGGSDAPELAALEKALRHYDKVATDATYAQVAAYPGFAETHSALRALVDELSQSGPES